MPRPLPRPLVVEPLLRPVRLAALQQECDQALLKRFVGEQSDEAFEVLVVRHGSAVWSVCRHFLANHHDAEDAFQATLMVLARKADRLTKQGCLKSWLKAVAFRVAKKAIARQARRRRLADMERLGNVVATDPGGPPESRLMIDELSQVLKTEIDRLPRPCRDAFILCHCLEYSHEVAARSLRCSVRTVHTRVKQARALLQERLGRRQVGEAGGVPAILARAGRMCGSSHAVPPELIARSVHSAAQMVGSGKFGAGLPPVAYMLANTVMREKGVRLLKVVTCLLCMATFGTVVAEYTAGQQTTPPDPQAITQPSVEPPAAALPTQIGQTERITDHDVAERTLHEVVAPQVLAILQQNNCQARLKDVNLERDTMRANIFAAWHPAGVKEATIHFRYDILPNHWEMWSDAFSGHWEEVRIDKTIIIRTLGHEFTFALPAVRQLRTIFELGFTVPEQGKAQ
jgi:RNA polymerase sigma factor (sigma-70 family)